MKKRKQPATGADLCPHCSECLTFFAYARDISPELGEALQKLYCQENYYKCARYYVMERLSDNQLPADLYPNQEIRAYSIVKEAQSRYS